MLKYHIQTVELSTAQAFVQFDSIPQGYSDLLVLMSARSSQSSRSTAITFAFNYDNSSSYSFRKLIGYDSSQLYTGSGSGTPAQVPEVDVTGNSATANTFGNTSFYISNYTSANPKVISVDQTSENNSNAGYVLGMHSYRYSSTSPITSIQFGLQGHNYMAGSTISLYGVRRGSDGIVNAQPAYGGEITTSGGYTIHTFNSSGTFTTTRPLECEYLIIAGGGAGGLANYNANATTGGGGAGGYRTSVIGATSGGGASAEARLNLPAFGSYAVVVGAGAAGATSVSVNAPSGTSSSVAGISTVGGGGGSSGESGTGGASGGSGGGGAFRFGIVSGGAGTSSQGFAGGTPVSNINTGGSGGGAGGAGSSQAYSETALYGGAGLENSITGTSLTRARGGQGSYGGPSSVIDGSAGSGSGGFGYASLASPNRGGNGGSGVVIIRYLTP